MKHAIENGFGLAESERALCCICPVGVLPRRRVLAEAQDRIVDDRITPRACDNLQFLGDGAEAAPAANLRRVFPPKRRSPNRLASRLVKYATPPVRIRAALSDVAPDGRANGVRAQGFR
jgi:hypothetical protein